MTLKHQILELPINHLIDEAEQIVAEKPKMAKTVAKSIAAQIGYLGELVAMEYLQLIECGFTYVDKWEYDIVLDNGATVDVKTQQRMYLPEEWHSCQIHEYQQSHQRPDYYLFVSLHATNRSESIRRFSKAHILGSIDIPTFKKKAQRLSDEELIRRNRRTDLHVVDILVSDLNPPKQLITSQTRK